MNGRWGAVLLCLLTAVGCRRPTDRNAASSTEPRVVSLAPNITEMLFAIGAGELMVGRTSACDTPSEVSRLPIAGDFGRPFIERLLALHPTVVISADLEDKTLPPAIERLGIRHVMLSCRMLDDVPRALRQLGEITGNRPTAEHLAAEFERNLTERRAAARSITAPPTVYLELWHDPILTAGSRSWIAELIRLAGGRNLGDVVDREYFEVSPEWILQADPDIVLCPAMDGGDAVARRMAERPGWAQLRALRTGRVVTDIPADLLLRPGPRALQAVDALAAAIRRVWPEPPP